MNKPVTALHALPDLDDATLAWWLKLLREQEEIVARLNELDAMETACFIQPLYALDHRITPAIPIKG
jgi:hypothetical protein